MHIGFIGLGNMGQPLATNVLASGYDLVISDLNRERGRKLEADGATWCDDPAELAAAVDLVITSLPGPPQVKAVLEPPGGVLRAMRAGTTWIDMSTSDPAQMRRLAGELEERRCGALDVPVSGGCERAWAGNVTLFASGDEATYKQFSPVLEAMGGAIFYYGALGNATRVKLLTNAMGFVHQAVLGEALMLGKRAGIDLEVLAEGIKAGYAGSYVVNMHVHQIFDGSYDPEFNLALALKDLRLATGLAAEVDSPTPVISAVQARFEEAAEQYTDQAGDLAHIRLLEDATGVLVRP